MMKMRLAIRVLVLSAAACSPARAPQPVSPVVFEVENFKLEAESEGEGKVYRGSGALVTKDPRLQTGTFVVLLKVAELTAPDTAAVPDMVILQNGLGTVQTFKAVEKGAAAVEPRYDWRVLGYTPVERASLMTRPAPARTPAKN